MALPTKRINGFTLTELITSVAIIGLLANLALATISKQRKRAHLAEVTTIIATGLKIAGIESQNPTYRPTDDCSISGITTKDLQDWDITCSFKGEIFTITASGSGSNPKIPTTLSTGQWSLNRLNGAITTGTPSGI